MMQQPESFHHWSSEVYFNLTSLGKSGSKRFDSSQNIDSPAGKGRSDKNIYIKSKDNVEEDDLNSPSSPSNTKKNVIYIQQGASDSIPLQVHYSRREAKQRTDKKSTTLAGRFQDKFPEKESNIKSMLFASTLPKSNELIKNPYMAENNSELKMLMGSDEVVSNKSPKLAKTKQIIRDNSSEQ